MKLYINNAKEDWIVDRFKKEWDIYNFKSLLFPPVNKKGIIWLIAPWKWNKFPNKILETNKVICTIHHIDDSKFSEVQKVEFFKRDKYIDKYHVISDETFNKIKNLSNKPVEKIPFWANQYIWHELENKSLIRKKYNLKEDDFLIGSFQRDTEGKDLKSPKLSKGPDRFLKIVHDLYKNNKNIKIILAGKRRQYLIEKLSDLKIEFRYFEMLNFSQLNELYNILNLYIVASRVEGGPQSVIESALCKTPIISTNVGIVGEILSKESIFDMTNFLRAEPNVTFAYNNVLKFTIPQGFDKFNKMFKNLYEN